MYPLFYMIIMEHILVYRQFCFLAGYIENKKLMTKQPITKWLIQEWTTGIKHNQLIMTFNKQKNGRKWVIGENVNTCSSILGTLL